MKTGVRLLKAAVIGGETLFVGWCLATEDLRGIGLLALGVGAAALIGALAVIGWPLGALVLLSASSAMPRLAATVGGLHLRPEHIAIAFVSPAVCVHWLRDRNRSLRLWAFDYFLIIYVGLNFFTSAVTSPDPRMTLRWALLNAIVICPYFLVRLLITDQPRLRLAFHVVLWVGALEAVYGLFCFLSNLFLKTSIGVEMDQYGAFPGTYGTQFEANLFGSYTACCSIMFLAYFLLGKQSSRVWYGLGFGFTLVAAVISLARSVYVALPVAMLVVVWVAFRKRDLQIRKFAGILIGAGLLLGLFSPFIVNLIEERFSTIDLSDITSDNTTMERLLQVAVALEDIKARPILGTGTASFHLFFDPSDFPQGFAGDAEEAGWISNTPLRILHDTGIVGLVFFVLFVGFLVSAVRRTVKKVNAADAAIMLSLCAGGVVYAITFQATEATMLAFTWVHLGILAAAVTVLQPAPLNQQDAIAR